MEAIACQDALSCMRLAETGSQVEPKSTLSNGPKPSKGHSVYILVFKVQVDLEEVLSALLGCSVAYLVFFLASGLLLKCPSSSGGVDVLPGLTELP